MIGPLAALLLAGLAPDPAPVPIELDGYFDRAEALNGRWVEFDAYVLLMGDRGGYRLLTALTGEVRVLPDGSRAMLCGDNTEAHVAVLLHGSLSPLRLRDARPPNAYAGVRIRGIVRNRPYTWRRNGFDHEWIGLIDNASIVRVTGENCAITLPEGSLAPPGDGTG